MKYSLFPSQFIFIWNFLLLLKISTALAWVQLASKEELAACMGAS